MSWGVGPNTEDVIERFRGDHGDIGWVLKIAGLGKFAAGGILMKSPAD